MNEPPIRVLLIEDNTVQANMFITLLEQATFRRFAVERMMTLQAGLKRLADGGIDVVLSDLALHDSYGLDTLVHIQDQAWDVPVVLLTNIEEPAVALQAIESGAQDYLVKSRVDTDVLERALLFAIERHKRFVEVERHYRRRLGDDT